MTVSLSSPITGGAQTGLTSPTYTVVSDTPPGPNAKQYAVTTLGGTQTGVDVHAISKPFTVTFSRPLSLRTLGSVNPITGVVSVVPRNVFQVLIRKGVLPLTGQANQTMVFRLSIEQPAGADQADPEDIRAGLSLLIGALNQISSGLGDTLISGVL